MILGIDYGTKRVGIALSDQGETLAFPHAVLQNTKTLTADIAAIVQQENVHLIVLGYSSDLQGNDNPLMERIHEFKKELETQVATPIVFEQEWLSSQEASRFMGAGDMLDASAAAIILQRFLDKKRFQQ